MHIYRKKTNWKCNLVMFRESTSSFCYKLLMLLFYNQSFICEKCSEMKKKKLFISATPVKQENANRCNLKQNTELK